jgi:hypothetical protein
MKRCVGVAATAVLFGSLVSMNAIVVGRRSGRGREVVMSVDSPEAIKGNRCFKGLIILGVLRCSNRRLRRIAFPRNLLITRQIDLHQSLFAVVKV